MEMDQQAYLQVTQFKLGKELRLIKRRNPLDRLRLHDDDMFYQQIGKNLPTLRN